MLAGAVIFSFWLSGEIKQIVHLIRWNLKAVYANRGKIDLTTVPEREERTKLRS